MKVLITASMNKGSYAPFIVEQCEALKALGVEFGMFGIEGAGVTGYLRNLRRLRRAVRSFGPDLIHAHYGLSGLLANLQRRVPVVTTYHGSDINDPRALPFSIVSMRLSRRNIFVSRGIMERAGAASGRSALRSTLIPCGVNLAPVTERLRARSAMGLRPDGKYVLFSGACGNAVKNYPLAVAAVSRLNGGAAELLELRGYTREQVNLLMCGCDALLMTSFTEGSPQVVKEAMAAGCPVVSVDVGDVAALIRGVRGCFIAERTPEALAGALSQVFALGPDFRTRGRERITELGLTGAAVAERVLDVYKSVRPAW